MRNLLLIIFVLTVTIVSSQQMRIGVFHSKKISEINLSPEIGGYNLYGDTTFLRTVLVGEKISLRVSGSKVIWKQEGGKEIVHNKYIFVPSKNQSSLHYAPIRPSVKSRAYEDGLEVSSLKSKLNLVNIVDMEDYLSGVIESEGGGGKHLSYYKVQALMSRTYALKNKKRHVKDHFQLCDGVHCQAYHNKLKHTEKIRTAAKETKGEVLVDGKNNLVTSFFSANCGGQTCDASYVWNNSVSYVESFVDTFCIHTRQATWSKKIRKSVWKRFLEVEYGVKESEVGDLLYNFEQDQRKAFFIHPSLGIPLRDLRKKFKLKSIYFSTHLDGDYVQLEGKGFGHGVGLCQEGAMKMAKSGYSHSQIARFYFKNVRVIDYYKELYFKQEGAL